MFCSICGQQYQDGVFFCSKCGATLAGAAQAKPVMKSGGNFPVWAVVLVVLVLLAVPVIGILAAIAIPAYSDYSVKSKMAGVYSVAQGARVALNQYTVDHPDWPAKLEETGFVVSSPQVKSARIDSDNGTLVLEIGFSPYQGKFLEFLPVVDQGKNIVAWKCKSDNIPFRHMPSSCRVPQSTR